MIAFNFISRRIRSSFLFGLGSHLAVTGLLVLAMYYLVTEISTQEARELLGWVVPAAQGSCFLAALSLAIGLSTRESHESGEETPMSGGWMIRKILPFGKERQRPESPAQPVERTPSSAEVEETLCLLKAIDWKVFKDLGIAYFRELGFSALDQPNRAKGVDFLLYTQPDYSVVGVRCLPWGTEQVDLNRVRDFHRAVLLAGASKGVMLTTGVFDEDALAFGAGNSLELLSGADFAARLLSLPPDVSQKLLQKAARAERIRDEGKEETKDRQAKVANAESRRWF